MLEQSRVDDILTQLRSADIDVRLEAINKARLLQSQMFDPVMTDLEWSRAAMAVEALYNLVREQLRAPQAKIVERATEVLNSRDTKKPKVSKTPKKIASKVNDDLAKQMQAEIIAAILAEKKGESSG